MILMSFESSLASQKWNPELLGECLGSENAALGSRGVERLLGKMTLLTHIELLPCARGSDVIVNVSHRGKKLVIPGRSRWKDMSFAA